MYVVIVTFATDVLSGAASVAAVFDPEMANEFGELGEVGHVWREGDDETQLLGFDYAYDRL